MEAALDVFLGAGMDVYRSKQAQKDLEAEVGKNTGEKLYARFYVSASPNGFGYWDRTRSLTEGLLFITNKRVIYKSYKTIGWSAEQINIEIPIKNITSSKSHSGKDVFINHISIHLSEPLQGMQSLYFGVLRNSIWESFSSISDEQLQKISEDIYKLAATTHRPVRSIKIRPPRNSP